MTLIYFFLALTALPVLSRVVRVLARLMVELIGVTVVMALGIILLLAVASHGRLI